MKSKFEGFDEEEEAFLRSITSISTPSKRKIENKSPNIPEAPKTTIRLNNKPTTRQIRFTSDEKLLDLLEISRNSASLPINGSIAIRPNDLTGFQMQEHIKKSTSQVVKQDSSISQIPNVDSEYKNATEILQDKMLEGKRRIKVANMGKKIEKNIFKQIRYTNPKKRNIISKMLLQKKLKRGFYDDIEFEYDRIGQNKIDKAKNSNTKEGKRFYREVQEYEDAIQDVETRSGWRAFKIGLATLMLSASLIAVNKIPQNMEGIKNTTQTEVNKNNNEKIDEEQIKYFKENVKNYDGYEFDFLTDNELFSTKNKLAEIGNKLSKSTYEVVRTGNGDQEFLDSLVQKAFGSEYESFSDEQKRDYRQLAYEVLRINCSTLFNPTETCIRNPIVWDVLQAKDQMKRKGYYSNFIINADQQEHLKTIGSIMHIENTTDLIKYQNASLINKGQDLLDSIVKEATNEKYESLSKTEKRDYKQITYELLPTNVKELFIKDPIEVDKSLEGYEYGE